MRILHISKYYYPYIGGVENICKYLVDNSTGHEMAVLCFNEGKTDCIDKVDGIHVYRVGSRLIVSRQALSLSYFAMMRRALREFKPDIIHFHWANPFPAAVLLTMIPKNVHLVVHWHMDIIKQKRIYPLIKPVETALLRRADIVAVTSPQYRDDSVPLQPFREKIRIVPNAINEDDFILKNGDEKKIAEVKKQYGNKPIVFFVGRHIQYKGLPYLIEAEKHVKSDCVFVIAGSGPLTDKLKDSCTSKRVHFVGKLNADNLRWHYYASSVFAFPSISKNEAFGVALAEAMYCYTPAVTFTIEGSGVNWVNLNGITGIEVPNGDVHAYASAIDRLLGNAELLRYYGEAAHKRVVDNFTIPRMVSLMDECYYACINKI